MRQNTNAHQAIINRPEAMKLEVLFIPLGYWHHLIITLVTNDMINEV